MVHYDEYLWVFVVGTVVCLFVAWGIGANDVANSFASSVGAKALTMKQAILVAAVFEFLGAVLLGFSVTDTIRSNIAKLPQFSPTPDLLMFGMLIVLVSAGVWLLMATYWELPVSTTHTTVGAVVGMAVVMRGFDSVLWSAHQDPFPYVKGMVPIFLSWVVSPILSGIIAVILFFLTRTFVLRSKHAFQRAFVVLPAVVWLTFFIILIFIIQTGGKNATWAKQSDGRASWIAAVIATGIAALVTLILSPYIKRVLAQEEEASRVHAIEEGAKQDAPVPKDDSSESSNGQTAGSMPAPAKMSTSAGGGLGRKVQQTGHKIGHNPVSHNLKHFGWYRALMASSNTNVHEVVQTDEGLTAMYANAEVFDPRAERVFRYVQICTACAMSFAHGSNDVANSIGPYSTIYNIWSTSTVPKKAEVPEWILVLGGAGIVLGLATYGYKIIRVLGVKATKLTNSRGYCVELASAITVVLASRYGLPVSTTQVLTGAVLAVGLFEGLKGVQWKQFAKIFAGWVLTLVVAALMAAALTAVFIYSPNKHASDDELTVYKGLNRETQQMLVRLLPTNGAAVADYNKTLTGLTKAAIPHLVEAFKLQNRTFQTTIASASG